MSLVVILFFTNFWLTYALDVNYHKRCSETLQTFADFEQVKVPYDKLLTFFDPNNCQVSTTTYTKDQDVGESGRSSSSQTNSRERALALIVSHVAAAISGQPTRCLSEIKDLSIWNLLSWGHIDQNLPKDKLLKYISSEYFPTDKPSGVIIDGIRHENLESPSFVEPTFDIIVAADVYEHVPRPYSSLQKLLKAINPGGALVLVVPFAAADAEDILMARMLPNGTVINGPGNANLKPPLYHGSRVHPAPGWQVFNIFGQNFLKLLCKIGYYVTIQHVQDINHGIPSIQIVIVAWKRKGHNAFRGS